MPLDTAEETELAERDKKKNIISFQIAIKHIHVNKKEPPFIDQVLLIYWAWC